MKNSNKLSKLFALSIMALTLTNCGSSTNAGGGGGDSDNSQGVEITSPNTVVANSTLNLAATLTFATTTTPTFIWTIRGNTTFASINGNTLTGISPGNITLVATYGTRTGTQKFTVTPAPPLAAPTALKAVATGVANQVRISWMAVAGATGYKVYQSASDLSGLAGGNPANLPTASATSTEVTTAFADIILSGTAKTYFLVTAVNNGVESLTAAAQIAATAHPLEFLTVAGGGTDTFWMDRNLGASQVATSATDTTAYGDLYQWGRRTNGHQERTGSSTTERINNLNGNGSNSFVSVDGDWLADGVDNNGAIRSAIWSSVDGSGVCPTGFRVPTSAELEAEKLFWTPPQNAEGAFNSSLKLPTAGKRILRSGLLGIVSDTGHYWSSNSSTDANKSKSLDFTTSLITISSNRTEGLSVRCIQN